VLDADVDSALVVALFTTEILNRKQAEIETASTTSSRTPKTEEVTAVA